MKIELIEILKVVQYVLKNISTLEFSENLCHAELYDGFCVRLAGVQNHYSIHEIHGSYIGEEYARIKRTFPNQVRIINIQNSHTVHVNYYGIVKSYTETLIRKEFCINLGNDEEIIFDAPCTKDEYFNASLIHNLSVKHEVLQEMYELSLLLNTTLNCVVIHEGALK